MNRMESVTLYMPSAMDFNYVKKTLDPYEYIECGACGAIKVEALVFLEVLNKICDDFYLLEVQDKIDDHEYDQYLDRVEKAWAFIMQSTETDPTFDSGDSPDQWSKWKKWCGRGDLNPWTPTREDLKSSAFDQSWLLPLRLAWRF